ncbi:chemosensory receptor A [Elysia marginata]|uniref:Chemosensory receptor A n=1 Tax=Elysia marginata TaxID=1093978 RepID=A0AAV4FS72_9GAST|nr:chemosensory receptor A [Elysia marginata]
MDNSTWSPRITDSEMGNAIDHVVFYYLSVGLNVVLNPVCALLAFCAGIVNIATFSQMDLSQGVNMNLLILSVSDFVLAIILVLMTFTYISFWFGIKSMPIQQVALFGFRTINYPVTASTAVTTVIAVVRCLSVVIPLTFRSVVTVRRQIVAIALGCLIGWSVQMYNQILALADIKSMISRNSFDIFRNVFFFTCLSIIVASMVFLTIALQRSSMFQSRAASTSDSQSKTQNRREARVMKSVILVLTIFVVCNIPLLMLSIMRLASIEFSRSGQYRSVEDLVDLIVGLGISLNASLNTFVYLFHNTQYRNIIKTSFSHQSRSSR